MKKKIIKKCFTFLYFILYKINLKRNYKEIIKKVKRLFIFYYIVKNNKETIKK